jgi:phosphate transport system ATP-binding protein
MNDASPAYAAIHRTTGASAQAPKLAARGLDFWYGDFRAVKDIALDIPEKRVTALIGPSVFGK